MIATPRAPLCEHRATEPAGGIWGAKEALSLTRGSVCITPRQLGPTMRMPWWRTRSSSSRCSLAPAAPVSAKPAEIRMMARAPAAAQLSTTAAATRAGTATMPRSMGAPIASTEG